MSLILLFGCKIALPLLGESGSERWWGGTNRQSVVISGTRLTLETPKNSAVQPLTICVLFFLAAEENL